MCASIHAPQIGHPRLDDEHGEFVELAMQLRAANDDALLFVYDTLHAHARSHFAFEESLMAPYEFASKACHVEEHAAVLKSFEEVREAVLGGRSRIARSLADQIIAWLPEHVDALDRHLAKFIFFQKTGGAPVLLRR